MSPHRALPFLLALALFLPTHAQPTTHPTTLPPETPPTATLHIPGQLYADSAGFSVDARSVYLLATVRQIPLWPLLTHHWPELLFSLWTMLALRGLIRIYLRKQDPLHEHCSKCNYSLHNLPTDTCPECGTKVTPRHRSRGLHRRAKLLTLATLTLAPVLIYVLHADTLPRTGRWTHWFTWRSYRLADYADKADNQWLLRHTVNEHELITIDAATGAISHRTTLDIPVTDTRRPDANHAVVFDGRYFFVGVRQGADDWHGVVQFDIHTGRVIRTLRGERYDMYIPMADPAANPPTLYLGGTRDRITAWNADTGELIGEHRFAESAAMCRMCRVGGRLVLTRNAFASNDNHCAFHAWDPAAGKPPTSLMRLSESGWWIDDRGAICVPHTERTPLTFDRLDASGRIIETIPIPRPPAGAFFASGNGRWLNYPSDPPTTGLHLLDVRNPVTHVWIPLPQLQDYRLSPTGRTLLTATGNPRQPTFRLYALP